MSNKPIKLRARLRNGITTVKALMYHPMETGLRKDKTTGQLIPAHIIQEVTCKHNGILKLSIEFGISASKNPFIEFELEGAAIGDSLQLAWIDNLGETDSVSTEIR